MVRSVEAVVKSDATVQKVAEIDLYFFRLPFATDTELEAGAVERCTKGFEQQGEFGLNAINPRLRKLDWVSWMATVDVTEASPYTPPVQGLPIDPVTWGLICYLIAGILIGWLITKWWVYRVIVRPKEQALQDIANSLTDTIAWKHERLAAGDITQEFSDELDADLEEAREKAEEHGKDPEYDWVDFLAQALEFAKYIPWIVGGFVTLSFIKLLSSFAPRRD